MKKFLSTYIFIIALIASCSTNRLAGKHHRLIELNGFAQGTTFSVSYIANDSVLTMGEVMKLFDELDQSLSVYKKNTLINRFNESAEGVEMDRHLKAVAEKAFEASINSDGLFDITVYPLVNIWGFADHERQKNLPDSATINSLKSCVGYDLLELKGSYLHKKKPCVRIDVNGIAQGYSVDYIASALAARSVKNYLVEIGGEIKAAGANIVNKRNWTIAIEQPNEDDPDEPFRAFLELKNAAVTTSGNYRRFYTSNGKHISHLIDPRSGYSFTNNMISATVLAKTAMTADAYDNVLMALGMEKAIGFVNDHKELEAYIIYKNTDGTVADTMTTGFKKMMVNPD